MNVGSIKESEKSLIKEIFEKRSPNLFYLLEKIGIVPLKNQERELIRSVLAEELVEVGMGNDYEPNSLGKKIDSIIGKLMFC